MARRRKTQFDQDELMRQLGACDRAIEYAEVFANAPECAHCTHYQRLLNSKMHGFILEYEEILNDSKKLDISDLLAAKVAYAQALICKNLADLPKSMVANRKVAIERRNEIKSKMSVPVGEILR